MKIIPIFSAILVAVLIIIYSSAYTVDETEQVFITEFGKPVGTKNTDPAKNEAGLQRGWRRRWV